VPGESLFEAEEVLMAWGRWGLGRAFALGALLALIVLSPASARTTGGASVNWLQFGNTPNENRYSPLTQITPDNVPQLGRVFTFDLNKAVPGIKKGQQSYPIVVDGTIYVTSGDDQVFAVNGATGALLWHYAPDNVGTFKNYGIVVNRGVSYCDGKLFLLTLDMTLVALDPATGNQLGRIAIGHAVSGAFSTYGYSETSAPICANHTVVIGAAGSDYGVRGFVMAYHTDLTPAWANPFWIIPPTGTEWRSKALLVGGATNWTPETVDLTTNTLYFGTAAASPAYYPSLRPGSDPRADSIVAVDLATGKLKWWQQQLAYNEWAYDTSQPPLVYTAKIGGKPRRIVSVATMEGMWFAYDAKTGAPIYQRIKVLDNVEHPALVPGRPVAVYPSSLGGLNYSPASYDPVTNYVYNAASETASVLQQQTPAQEQIQQLLLGNTFLGLGNGDFGQYLQTGWKDYGSISAIDVSSGKVAWKIDTPQPERGGVTTTASGLGFAGGGDGVLRAFDAKTGNVLWKFQTGFQIAAGASIYSVNGTEYVAITVGGTTTSSSGGTVASQLQVFSLGGSQTQSTGPVFTTMQRAGVQAHARSVKAATPQTASAVTAGGRAGSAKILLPGPVQIAAWDPNSSNTEDVQGRVTLAGRPVAGVAVRVDGWVAPATDKDGLFTYPADNTMPARHVVTVATVDGATVDGRKLTKAEQSELASAKGGITVGYSISNVSARPGPEGTVVVTGRISYGKGLAPRPVQLYSYELTGTITDANGNPVKGAIVTTRTADHKFWTFSRPTGANGKYTSFLVAADQEGDNPVPMTVAVSVGSDAYTEPVVDSVNFPELRSSRLDIQLPSSPGATLVKTSLNPEAIPGATYRGLLVGVVGGRGRVIKPVKATWPDASGRFELVLPASARGAVAKFWESERQYFSTGVAKPGANVDPSVYPSSLAEDTPQAIATVKLPG
jgi:PQQ-dependent dehydrogenase (methanol/ethanol family)